MTAQDLVEKYLFELGPDLVDKSPYELLLDFTIWFDKTAEENEQAEKVEAECKKRMKGRN